jgi:hypothetical protein
MSSRISNSCCRSARPSLSLRWYYWFPKMTGYMYSEFVGKLHFSLTLSASILPFPQVELLIIAFAGWSYVSSDREHSTGRAFAWSRVGGCERCGFMWPAPILDFRHVFAILANVIPMLG